MKEIRDDNYITIQGFMRNLLGLRWNNLLIYAIIYGFSQTTHQAFTGSQAYLANWCGSTVQGVQKNLNFLVKNDYIVKVVKKINNVKYVEYSVNFELIDKLENEEKISKAKQEIINFEEAKLYKNKVSSKTNKDN